MKTIEIVKLETIYGGGVCDSYEDNMAFIGGASLAGALFGGIVGLALGSNISTIYIKLHCAE